MQLKAKIWCTVFFLFLLQRTVLCNLQNETSIFKSMYSFRNCFSNKHPVVCVKEKALDVLNETIMSDTPMTFFDMMTVERNPEYLPNVTEEENLPQEVAQRSMKLSDILYDRVEDFFKSRTLKFNMAPAFEGRKKGGGKGKGGMMVMGMVGMACMMAQMMMGKIAFLAGAALIMAKLALMLSAIATLKKMSGGGGGGESHVVYTSGGGGGGDYGHSHGGGGGWHRSLDADNGLIGFSTHITENTVSGL